MGSSDSSSLWALADERARDFDEPLPPHVPSLPNESSLPPTAAPGYDDSHSTSLATSEGELDLGITLKNLSAALVWLHHGVRSRPGKNNPAARVVRNTRLGLNFDSQA